MDLESLEAANQSLQADLKLAFKRIGDLQAAIEDEMESDENEDLINRYEAVESMVFISRPLEQWNQAQLTATTSAIPQPSYQVTLPVLARPRWEKLTVWGRGRWHVLSSSALLPRPPKALALALPAPHELFPHLAAFPMAPAPL